MLTLASPLRGRSLPLLLTLGSLAAAPASAQFSFGGVVVGPEVAPEFFTHADVDGDGDQDLVVTSNASAAGADEVVWAENLNGLGTALVWHPVGGGLSDVRGVAAADLDGDGDVDVVVAEPSANALRWYANDGTGAFGSLQTVATGLSYPNGVFTADVDGDGDLDVFWNSALGTVAWHENLGAGAFSAATVVTTTSEGSEGLELEDLDGDGDVDLFVPRGVNLDPAWFENSDGQGAFSGPHVVGAGGGWFAADAGDVDADGDVDLVGGDNVGGAAWVRNDATGSFSAPEVIAPSGQIFAVLAADVDVDGDLDVFAANNGTGTQLFRKSAAPDQFTAEAVVSKWMGTSLLGPDLDGDGDPELAICTWTGDTLVVHVNDGTGPSGFGPVQSLAIQTGSPGEVLAADLDGDGDADAVLGYADSTHVAWSENFDGLGRFVAPRFVQAVGSVGGATSVSGAIAEDLDGVGDRDLAWSETSTGFVPAHSALAWSANDGSGGFGAKTTVFTATSKLYDAAAADLDGDGDLDLAGAPGSGPILWHANVDGLGTFGAQQSTGVTVDTPTELEPADLDGDGDLDLLVAGAARITWLVNDGTGGFFGGADLVTSPPAFASARSGDLDADGDLDVVSRSGAVPLFHESDVFASRNLGAGVFAAPIQTPSILSGLGRLELHDLDGDGAADVLLASAAPGNGVQWLLNDGAGTLAGTIDVVTDPGSQSRATAVDLDLDGLPDVIWSDLDSGTVSWSRNDLCPGMLIFAASETKRFGSPENPDSLKPGLTSGPVLGATWDPHIYVVYPDQIVSLLAIGLGEANVPTFYGTLLVDVTQPYATASTPPGVPFAIPIPASCGLIGLKMYAQGARVTPTKVKLTNGLDIVLGY